MADTQPMPLDGESSEKGKTDPSLGPALELLGQDVGGYLVEGLLGVGGMGLVYQAKLKVIARKFAIKVLRPEVAQDPVVAANFLREAQTLSQLKHPHIIDIVGFGQIDTVRQYMVMEFLEGRTLADELEEKGALLPQRALELADAILDGLEAAHSVEVIHRDLKPSNVFLAKVSGGAEVVKLLDFGLAKHQPVALEGLAVVANAEAGKSVVAGTPEYIAPEQARGHGARKHSDLYSFGVMLYEMLTGHQPFEPGFDVADRTIELLRAHLHQPAPKLSKHSGMPFPHELEEIVADLLSKDPEARPSSAAVARARLQKISRGLQAEATRQGQNPLLLTSAMAVETATSKIERVTYGKGGIIPGAPSTLKLERQSGTDELDAVALQPRRTPWLIAFVALALGGLTLVFWPAPAAPPVVPAMPIAVSPPPSAIEPVKPSPATEVATKPAPIVAEAVLPVPVPAPHAPDADLLVNPAPEKKPALKPHVYRVDIREASCEPNARWKTAEHSHLEELQGIAASRDDKKMWSLFEQAEPSLNAAIDKAASGGDCEAVETRIQKLANQLKR